MKKVLLLEDRKKRQENYLKDIDVQLQNYSQTIDNKIGTEYTNIRNDFDTFLATIADNYLVIIAHESGLKSINKIDVLKEYCKKESLPLVLYSGGTNYISYSNDGYELLFLNSKDLYNQNLKKFLEDAISNKKYNLQLLAYGENFKINILFNILEKLEKFINTTHEQNKITFEQYIDTVDLSTLKEKIEFEDPQLDENGWIKISDLNQFSKELKCKILEKVSNAF